MLRLALAGLRAHRIRTTLTVLAVTIGVSFLSGTLIYRDTATTALYQDLAQGGIGVDVAIQRPGPQWSRWRGVDQATLDRVRKVPGVATVDGRVVAELPLLDHSGRVLSNVAAPGVAVSVPSTSTMSMFTLVAGRVPVRSGEAALDRATAQREHLNLGDTVRVVDPAATTHSLSVVGLVDFGPLTFAGFSALVLTGDDLRTLTPARWYSQIAVAATPGTDPAELRSRIATLVGPGFDVITGQHLRDRLARDSAKYVEGFLAAILACALIALVVASLVVYNTFSILTAQRLRELALLRCLGASRRQLVALGTVEAALVGLIASAAAVLLSLAAARGLLLARAATGGADADHPLVVSPTAVVLAVAVGTSVTVLSGGIPALSAGRIAPLAAVRYATDVAVRATHRPRRVAVAALLCASGFALTLAGRGKGFGGLPIVVAGGMAVFLAIVVVLPLVVVRLTAAVGWVASRLLGATGRLATTNAQRHPRRTSATAVMLMIGIAVMSMLSVILATARDQGARELAENLPVDFVIEAVSSRDGTTVLPDSLLDALHARSEFGAVARTRESDVSIDGAGTVVAAAEPGALGRTVAPEVLAGTLDALGPGTVALRARFVEDHGLWIGDTVQIRQSARRSWEATVVAVYDDTPTGGDAIVSWTELVARLTAVRDRVLVSRAEGLDAASARAALDSALASFPFVSVTSAAERRDATEAALDERLIEFAALLGVSALVAVFGIMDNLALSVVERSRESATLRALGLSAGQLRRMLLVEAVLSAVIGGGIGVAFGTAYGWIAASGLIDVYGHGNPVVPIGQLAILMAVAAGAGVLASLLPGRRAARASVVAALVDT